jgi:hypothetical protein
MHIQYGTTVRYARRRRAAEPTAATPLRSQRSTSSIPLQTTVVYR